MGLKTDLIDAKIEGLKLSGATDEAILQSQDALETQCQLEEDAIVNFLNFFSILILMIFCFDKKNIHHDVL